MVFLSWMFFAVFAQAERYHAICATQFPTTTFVVQSDEKEVYVRIYHHNGTQYAPFHSGLLVPQDLNKFAEDAKVAEKLGSEIEAKWKLSQCDRKSEKVFSCFGKGELQKRQGLEFAPFAAYSSHIQENGLAGKVEYIEMTLSYDVKGTTYHIPMKYSIQDCELL